MKKAKKLLFTVVAIVLIAIAAIWFLGDNMSHIEDTNGADNFELQTITDENICNLDMGSLNVNVSESFGTATYKSGCFSGVYEVFSENVITNRYEITVNHARVDSGNFKMVLCVNDEIVHTFALNELTQTYVIENVTGNVSLRIAGESADFMFDYVVY